MAEIIYSKYSNERSRRFAIRTDILEENKKRWLQKKALYPEGKEHMDNLASWNSRLNAVYEKVPFVCNKCEIVEDGVKFEYLDAESLSEHLDSMLQRGEIQAAFDRLVEFLKQVRLVYSQKPFEVTAEFQQVFGNVTLPSQLMCAEITNIDIVCDNVMLTEPITLLDYEWTFEFPVPCEYVLYRIIHYYIQTNSIRTPLNEEKLYQELGISEALQSSFAQMEKAFQGYITGSHVPMREMYGVMTPGMSSFSVETTGLLQVYFGDEEGRYYEPFSAKRPIMTRHADYTIDLPPECRKIRIDPGDQPCMVHIKKLAFDGQTASMDEAEVPDGFIHGSWALISRPDPHIKDIAVPQGAKQLTMQLEIYLENQDMLACLQVLQKENARLNDLVEQRTRELEEKNKPMLQMVYEKVMEKKGK